MTFSCLLEGEHEEAWLAEAGLARLFDDSLAADDQEEDSAVFLSTLTRTQAAAVQRRVSSYQQTLQRQRKRQHFPDVRDIFRPLEKDEEPPNLKDTTAETETELNVEVAFSEQALSYRDNNQRLKVTSSLNSTDDKLPVRHKLFTQLLLGIQRCLNMLSTCQRFSELFFPWTALRPQLNYLTLINFDNC
ncbi:hypothetical protein XENORESO_007977 [Xenotaenia resolanae]|uniref:Uncharacterized protein n=1 Tax=Xenotaenia resolanae TaxID=208358 RepID=A0ABV0WW15_9TELE